MGNNHSNYEIKPEDEIRYRKNLNHTKSLEDIPKSFMTIDIIKTALELNISNLKYIPNKYKNKYLYEFIVVTHEDGLKHVPNNYINLDLINMSVKKFGTSLKHVELKYRTKEVCINATEKDANSLEFVPKEFIDSSMILKSLKSKTDSIEYIVLVRPDLLTEEYLNKAIDLNPSNIKHLSSKIIDENLYKKLIDKAVSLDGSLFENIPAIYKSNELLLKAIKHNSYNIKFVDTVKNPSDEVFELAFKKNIDSFKLIIRPDTSIFRIAFKINPVSAKFIPIQYLNLVVENSNGKSNATNSVQNNKSVDQITAKLFELAVLTNGLCLQYIPLDLRTNNLIKLAVKNNGFAIKFCPDSKMNDSIIKYAIDQNPLSIRHLPKEKVTYELIKKVVTINGLAIKYHQSTFPVTYELAKIAINQNTDALLKLPDDLHFIDELVTKIYEKTNEECLISRDKICKNAPYYKCSRIAGHVYSKDNFLTWVKSNKSNSTNCITCIDNKIDISKIYYNTNSSNSDKSDESDESSSDSSNSDNSNNSSNSKNLIDFD